MTSPRRLRDPRGDLQRAFAQPRALGRRGRRGRPRRALAVPARPARSGRVERRGRHRPAARRDAAAAGRGGVPRRAAALPGCRCSACSGCCARRRGSAGVLGAARAIRDPALGFAAALALVVGISIVVFSTVMATTIRAGLVQGAHDEVGADIQVTRTELLPRRSSTRSAAIDGVRGARDASPVVAVSNSTVDTDAHRGLRASWPTPPRCTRSAPTCRRSPHKVDGRDPGAGLVGLERPHRRSRPAARRARGVENVGTISRRRAARRHPPLRLIDSAFAARLGIVGATTRRGLLVRLTPGSPAEVVADATRDARHRRAARSVCAASSTVTDAESLLD